MRDVIPVNRHENEKQQRHPVVEAFAQQEKCRCHDQEIERDEDGAKTEIFLHHQQKLNNKLKNYTYLLIR